MDLNTFKFTNPGIGQIKLFISSIDEVIGITISLFNCNQINFSYSLSQLTSIIINGTEIPILTKTPFDSHYYYETTPTSIDVDASNLNDGCFLVELIPSIDPIPFTYNTYNAILGNSETSRNNSFAYDVDRSSDQIKPKNIIAILEDTASPAKFQDSSYTDSGLINGRYNGSKTNIDDYGISPSLTGTSFEASIYLSSSLDGFICSQSLSDRTVETYIFTGKDEIPTSGSAIFQFNGNQIVPVRNKKMWVKSNTRVLYIDELGNAITSGSLCSI